MNIKKGKEKKNLLAPFRVKELLQACVKQAQELNATNPF